MRLNACRHYRAESSLYFEQTTSAAPAAPAEKAEPQELGGGVIVELALDTNLDPAAVKVGDAVKAKVARAVRAGDQVLIAEGSIAEGRIARLDTQSQPFLVHVVALEFDSIQIGERRQPFSATMVDAGPAAGLIRQAKRLDPKFSKRPTGRMDVLVREVQRGQGILLWDAKRGPLPRGLRMKWRVHNESAQR